MPELRHLNDTLGKVLWQSRIIFLGFVGVVWNSKDGRCRVFNIPKKEKPEMSAFQKPSSKKKSSPKQWFKSKIFETASLWQSLPGSFVCSNWNISHGIEIQECLKPSRSILVHQLEMHGHLRLDSPSFRLRWLLEGWAWTLFTFCNPKIGHLLGLCFQKEGL